MSIYSMIALVRFLLESGMEYILTNRFCQDPVEQYFGKQRAIGRRSWGRGSQNIIDKYLISAGTSSSSCASSIRPMSNAAVGVEARTKPLKSQQSSRKFGGLSEELSARFPTIRTSQSRRNHLSQHTLVEKVIHVLFVS